MKMTKKTQAYNSFLKQCCAFSNITRLRSDLIIFKSKIMGIKLGIISSINLIYFSDFDTDCISDSDFNSAKLDYYL